MRRSWLGPAFALFFLGGVGAAYYPGWRMERELREAAKDGLATTVEPKPTVPEAENAKLGFDAAVHRHPRAVRTLLVAAGRPDPEVDALVRELTAVAATHPQYGVEASGYDEHVIASAARTAARTAKDEAGLLGVARIAGTLRSLRDLSGMTQWARAAEGTLDAADRLHLSGGARQRVLDALGPPIDPREEIRHAMIDALGQAPGWSPTATWLERFRIVRQGKEMRYIAAWRAFWRTAPQDSKGFGKALGDVEQALGEMEWALGRRRSPDASFGASRRPWSVWYTKLEEIRARMRG